MLAVKQLVVEYPGSPPVTAIDGVDIEAPTGTTVALVGESGSGKSTVARAITSVTPVASGTILLDGEDVTRARGRALRRLRSRVQLVFQDPRASLSPRMTVGRVLQEASAVAENDRIDSARCRSDALRLLDLVGLPAAAADRYPHEMSGGQLQRVAIARALATKPELLLLDEVTASLDVSVQATILNLLRDLRAEFGLTCIYISHDLSIVRYFSDIVYVMERGTIVESGTVEKIYGSPRTEYTQRLLAAAPQLDGNRWRFRQHCSQQQGEA